MACRTIFQMRSFSDKASLMIRAKFGEKKMWGVRGEWVGWKRLEMYCVVDKCSREASFSAGEIQIR